MDRLTWVQVETNLRNPLAQGRNVLPGKHAYSHMIALSSAAKAYEVLGAEKYLRAIRNGWDMIEQTQQFASGGWGPKEAFVPPHEGKLGESLSTTREHFETPCGAYAHMKLARYLLRFTSDARYGDGLERLLYNTILASRDPGGDGEYFYYSDYQSGAKKGYYKRKWPCGSGTLLQSVADMPLGIYFHERESIYVNMFVPSTVRWGAVRIVKSTNYPEEDAAEIRVETAAPVEFAMNIRIPGWLQSPAEVRVNGRSHSGDAKPGAFVAIRRKWKNHDTVAVRFPMRFREQAVDDRHPKLAAVMRGPVMHVAVDPPAAVDTLSLSELTRKLAFRPFYQVRDETYNTYFQIL